MFKDIKHVWDENMRKEIKENDDIFHVGIDPEKLLYTEPKRVHVREKKLKDKYSKWVDVESDSNAETDENKKWALLANETNDLQPNKGNQSRILVADSNRNGNF